MASEGTLAALSFMYGWTVIASCTVVKHFIINVVDASRPQAIANRGAPDEQPANVCDARRRQDDASGLFVAPGFVIGEASRSVRSAESAGAADVAAFGFAERSVGRWLSELEDEGRVVKTGRKRGTRYRTLGGFVAGF